MYSFLLSTHSIIRWLVLFSLILAIVQAYRGMIKKSVFTKLDDRIRHWTATIAHLQLLVGIIVYSKSPIVKYFWKNLSDAIDNLEMVFFGLIHIILMLLSIVFVTIGSSLAKRKSTDNEKYRTIFKWFLVALFILFIAIPWPFSPLVSRPYLR